MNVHVERAIAATAIATGLAGAAWFGTAIGSACPVDHGTAAADGGVPGPDIRYALDYSGQLNAPGSGLAYRVSSAEYR